MTLRMRTPSLLAFYVQYTYWVNAGYKWTSTRSHIQAAGEPFGVAVCGYRAKNQQHVHPYDWADTKLGGLLFPGPQYRCLSCYIRTRQANRVLNWFSFVVLFPVVCIIVAVLVCLFWGVTFDGG